jgi:hypothetical protein
MISIMISGIDHSKLRLKPKRFLKFWMIAMSQAGIPILALAKLSEYQYRVLLLLRIPPNIRRTHLPGKEISAGL